MALTDWLPWGLALMTGTLTTLGLTLRALRRAPPGERPDLRAARWALVATAVVSGGVYALYLLFGERWVWYL